MTITFLYPDVRVSDALGWAQLIGLKSRAIFARQVVGNVGSENLSVIGPEMNSVNRLCRIRVPLMVQSANLLVFL